MEKAGIDGGVLLSVDPLDENAEEHYNAVWAEKWMQLDDSLYVKHNLASRDFLDHIYSKNLLRFLGKSKEAATKKLPVMGE